MNKNNHLDNRDIDWLIINAIESVDDEIKKEVIYELNKRGLNQKEIKKRYNIIKKGKSVNTAFEEAWEKEIEKNKIEKYTLREKIQIFLFAPYTTFKNYDSGLSYLHENKYTKKFTQRLILIIAGTIFWFLLFFVGYKYYEQKRIEKVNKIDISEWEDNR